MTPAHFYDRDWCWCNPIFLVICPDCRGERRACPTCSGSRVTGTEDIAEAVLIIHQNEDTLEVFLVGEEVE